MDVNGEIPGMKRSTSEWDLDAFFPPQSSTTTSPSDAVGCGLRDDFLLRPGSDDLGFNFTGSRDVNTMSCYLIGDQTKGTLIWPQNHTPRQPSISATIESQSSLCAGTPTSSNKPKSGDNLGPGATSGSDQSDEESMEIEGGLCEQSMDVLDLKRMRRMVSNRESARRSRRRKQAQLQDLELQVDQLRGENASLCKRLTDAGQQFNDAATDNRVLKSNVEALRIKVKMAEDLVARGSLACTLNHLLQSPSVAPHLLNTHQMCGAVDLPLHVDTQGDEARYISMDVNNQLRTAGMENSDHSSDSHGTKPSHNQSLERISSLDYLHNRISSELSTCGSDIWPWDSPIIPVSK